MDFRKVLEIIGSAASMSETVEIYYPATENTLKGWREIEPYSITTDIPPDGEHLIYEKDRLSPGHILNARPIKKKGIRSFIIGKIKYARKTGRKFTPQENWKIEF